MSNFHVPLPSHAGYIWLTDETLWLALPSQIEGATGHSLHFPATERGLSALLQVLRQREQEKLAKPKLNERGAPSQALVQAMLRATREHELPEVKYPYGLKTGKTPEELEL